MSNGKSNSFDLNVGRVIPGGSWVLVGECCRSAARHNGIWPDYRSPFGGLRLALRETGRVRDKGEKKERE